VPWRVRRRAVLGRPLWFFTRQIVADSFAKERGFGYLPAKTRWHETRKSAGVLALLDQGRTEAREVRGDSNGVLS
jgi:hypothetical protein